MSEGEALDQEMLSARIVDEALKLISDGHVTRVQLLEVERRWLSMGATPETCKTVVLLISAQTSYPQQSQRIEGARALIEEGVSLSDSYFGHSVLTVRHTMESTASYQRPFVMIIHGIETLAPWMDGLIHELEAAGFEAARLDYDKFGFFGLLLPWKRRKKIDWFLRTYEEAKRRSGGRRPSIIAHNFGTYLVAESIKTYGIPFERIILCGSIVARDFPWDQILDKGLAVAVMNDFGKQDFPVWIAEWVVQDAGAAGKYGFENTAGGRVVQIEHERFRHSDYFFKQNYKDSWIPFLKGESQADSSPYRTPRRNYKFAAVMVVLSVVAVITAMAVIAWLIW